jgi:hypothetical protein
MDDPEDLFQLVLGMAPAGVFRGVFADAGSQRPEALSAWFDARTARFGGKDAIEAVHSIVGNCLRFDFQQVSDRIPRVDLPALRPFLESMLVFNRRRPRDEDGRLSFTTPDEWKVQGIRRSYAGLSFDRSDTRSSREVNLVGVGHRVFDLAVTQALQLTAVAAAVTTREGLKFPLVTFRISDRITGKDTSVRNVIAGVEVLDEGELRLLRDWELLLHLNAVAPGYGARTPHSSGPVPGDRVDAAVAACRKLVEHSGEILDLRFELPQIDLMAVLWPAEAGAEPSPPGV